MSGGLGEVERFHAPAKPSVNSAPRSLGQPAHRFGRLAARASRAAGPALGGPARLALAVARREGAWGAGSEKPSWNS